MSYIKQLIGENERVVRVSYDHWVTLLPTAVVDILLIIVIIGLSAALITTDHPEAWYGLLLLAIPVGQFLIRLWIWSSRQYVVTTRRILQMSGILNKRVSDTSLDKVNDIVMEQTALGRLLGYGDIEIMTGTESGIDVFRKISRPILFKKSMLDQREALGSLSTIEERTAGVLGTPAGLVNDIPELIEGLDELRDKGLISDEEFEQKKRKLLDKI
jgi:uncharacterized membrane protein YdbT with pleckstrin-like domain